MKYSIFISKDNVKMKKEVKHNKLMNIRLNESLINQYKNYCDEKGLLLSKRIRFLMQKDMENKIKIEK